MTNNETRIYTCPYCHQQFDLSNKKRTCGFISSHKRFCEHNPKRQFYIDIIKASARRGTQARNEILRKQYLASLLEYTFVCEHCGKEYTKTFSPKQYQHYLKSHHFCSRSCANSHIHTPESRAKVSASLKKYHYHGLEQKYHVKREYRDQYGCRPHPCELRKTTCLCCKREIWVKTTAETTCYVCHKMHPEIRQYLLYTREGKKVISEETRSKLRVKALERVKAGIHKGWISRNITSYPEKFWKLVLDNNGIDYSFNFPIKKRDLGFSDTACYFIDFKLGENIDLEIDGGQHLIADRKKHDKERDAALKAHGWIVYRISWNEINTEEGRRKMKRKINKFFKWYRRQI